MPVLISDAIADYAARTTDGGSPPYDADSLGVIYGSRVAQLFALAAAGYSFAEWRYDETARVNRWHGARKAFGG